MNICGIKDELISFIYHPDNIKKWKNLGLVDSNPSGFIDYV